MDNKRVARELVRLAKSLVGGVEPITKDNVQYAPVDFVTIQEKASYYLYSPMREIKDKKRMIFNLANIYQGMVVHYCVKSKYGLETVIAVPEGEGKRLVNHIKKNWTTMPDDVKITVD